MKPLYLLYAVLIGLSPLVLGEMVAQVDPHSPWAYIPWYTIVTLPVAVVIGFAFALMS
jgi:hypothetical protein